MHKMLLLNILFSYRFLTLNNKATLTLTLALLALNVCVTLWDKEKCANAQCTVFKFCWTLQSCQLTNMDFPYQHGSDAVEEIQWFSCQEKMFFSPILLLEAAVWSYQTSLTLCQAAQHANPWKHMSKKVWRGFSGDVWSRDIQLCPVTEDCGRSREMLFCLCYMLSDNFSGVFLALRN